MKLSQAIGYLFLIVGCTAAAAAFPAPPPHDPIAIGATPAGPGTVASKPGVALPAPSDHSTSIQFSTAPSNSSTRDATTNEPSDHTSVEVSSTSSPDQPTSSALSSSTREISSSDTQPLKPTSTPDAPTSTPDAPTSTPDLPTSTPDVPTSTPDAPTSTPDAPTSTPDLPTSTPDLPTSTPDMPTSTPDVPTSTPDVPTSTPDAPTNTSGGSLPTSTPDVSTSTSSEPPSTATSAPSTTQSQASSTESSATSTSTQPPAVQTQTYLDGHNEIRQAYNAQNLQWSTDLEAKAQGYAEQCQLKHSDGALGSVGENLAAATGSFSASQAVQLFVQDRSRFNPKEVVFSHFTQVVWKSTTQLGCGVALCDAIFPGAIATYHVCLYDPVGNIVGEAQQNLSI